MMYSTGRVSLAQSVLPLGRPQPARAARAARTAARAGAAAALARNSTLCPAHVRRPALDPVGGPVLTTSLGGHDRRAGTGPGGSSRRGCPVRCTGWPHQRRERGLEDQAPAAEQVEEVTVLRGLVARVDRAPDRAAGAREFLGFGRDVAVFQAPGLIEKARGPEDDRGAAASAARQAGQCWTVRFGSMTRPKLRSTPSSSRWPNAWQPEANPTRCGGCCSSGYAAYACRTGLPRASWFGAHESAFRSISEDPAVRDVGHSVTKS